MRPSATIMAGRDVGMALKPIGVGDVSGHVVGIGVLRNGQ